MIRAHRIRLVPTKQQEHYFIQACGVARFAYNWALAEWERLYECGEARSELILRRKLNAIKDEQFPWMRDVTKNAPQQAIKNLGRAYHAFLNNKAERPKFKRKGVRDSFRADNGPSPCDGRLHAVKVSGKHVKLPRAGWVKMREPLRFQGQIMCATVSREADRWFVSLNVRIDAPHFPRDMQTAVGCDFGFSTLATVFDGKTFRKVPAARPLRTFARKLRRADKALARKTTGSANREKAKTKLARLHTRIRNIRSDALHKLTTMLASRYAYVGVEDLQVAGMLRNRHLSRAFLDLAFGECLRQLRYKTDMLGGSIVMVDKWFPSSKNCSLCGTLNAHVVWGVQDWKCEGCAASHDRDENAARNLYLAASSAVKACGAEGAGWSFVAGETSR